MTHTASHRSVGLLPLASLWAIVLLAACESSPVAPEIEDGAEIRALETALPSMEGSSPQSTVSGHLERLLQLAVHQFEANTGPDAARALLERLHRLQEEARRAREAGNEEAFRAAAETSHLEAARIVVEVLGREPLRRLRTFVEDRIRHVAEALRQAQLAGADVRRPRELLARAATLLEASKRTDRTEPALVAVARAADLLAHIEAPTDRAGTLFNLLGHALHTIVREQGADAAEAVQTRLRTLDRAVAEARRTDDAKAIRTAVGELESAIASVILGALGPAIVERVLHAGTYGIHQLEARIRRLRSTDRDVSELRRLLDAAVETHRAALAAASIGAPLAALRLGAHTLDLLGVAHD